MQHSFCHASVSITQSSACCQWSLLAWFRGGNSWHVPPIGPICLPPSSGEITDPMRIAITAHSGMPSGTSGVTFRLRWSILWPEPCWQPTEFLSRCNRPCWSWRSQPVPARPHYRMLPGCQCSLLTILQPWLAAYLDMTIGPAHQQGVGR